MLAEFEPGELEAKFERQAKAAAFLGLSAKSRFWDMYKNQFLDIANDTESSYRRLFADVFAKAYEEQLARLSKFTD
jgi:type VI secretion system protein ImpI